MTDFDPLAKKDEIDSALQTVGLYVDRMQIFAPIEAEDDEDHDDPSRHGAERRSHVLYMDCLIGDVAFTSRVQDAQQYTIDEEFSMLTRDFTSTEFDDIRRQLGGE